MPKNNISSLAAQVRKLEDQLSRCMRCGMCQSVCPLFEQTGREADVARGKLALLSGLMAKMFDDPQGVSDRLNKCLLCGSCAARCPSGVEVLDIFIRARAILAEYSGLSGSKKLVLRQVLCHPERLNQVAGLAEKVQGLVVKQDPPAPETACGRFRPSLLSGRHVPLLAKTPFHGCDSTAVCNESRHAGPRVLFFTGCLIDKVMPDIGHAVVKAMAHHKVSLIIPEPQGCCGIPALSAGDPESFGHLVRHHIRLFRKHRFDYLVTACATCTATIKKSWPALFDGCSGEREYVADLADKTLDISQFFIDVLKVAVLDHPGAEQAAVTVHDPCHLNKSLGITAQPRALILASGRPVKEMADPDKCCGMGGSFSLFYREISTKIGAIKEQNILNTGCRTVAAGCPACILQIKDMLYRSKAPVRVVHPVQLYADHLTK